MIAMNSGFRLLVAAWPCCRRHRRDRGSSRPGPAFVSVFPKPAFRLTGSESQGSSRSSTRRQSGHARTSNLSLSSPSSAHSPSHQLSRHRSSRRSGSRACRASRASRHSRGSPSCVPRPLGHRTGGTSSRSASESCGNPGTASGHPSRWGHGTPSPDPAQVTEVTVRAGRRTTRQPLTTADAEPP